MGEGWERGDGGWSRGKGGGEGDSEKPRLGDGEMMEIAVFSPFLNNLIFLGFF